MSNKSILVGKFSKKSVPVRLLETLKYVSILIFGLEHMYIVYGDEIARRAESANYLLRSRALLHCMAGPQFQRWRSMEKVKEEL